MQEYNLKYLCFSYFWKVMETSQEFHLNTSYVLIISDYVTLVPNQGSCSLTATTVVLICQVLGSVLSTLAEKGPNVHLKPKVKIYTELTPLPPRVPGRE